MARCCILQGLHFLVGTAFTPGIVEAWAAGDTLAMVGQFSRFCCFNGYTVNQMWGRRNVRSDEEGVLHKVGVGQTMVSPERWKPVENFAKTIIGGDGSVKYYIRDFLPQICFASVVVVTGRGAQSSALYNRISAVMVFVLMAGLNHPHGALATVATSIMATAVVSLSRWPISPTW